MGKQLMWIALSGLALVLVAIVVLKIVGALAKLLVTALVMLALVGGVLYLLGRARTALRGRGPRQLR